MDLFVIDPDYWRAHTLLYRDYNCLREFPGLLLEEVLALAYVEALTYTKAYNRIYFKTWVYQYENKYPKLVSYFYELKDQVLQFEDFFLRGQVNDLLEEIKCFGRLVVGNSIQDFWHFSKRFNARITYFDGSDSVIEINEAEFCEPIDVAIYKIDTIPFIVYRVSDSRDQIPGDIVKVPESIYEDFEELGLEILNTLKQDLNPEKTEVANKFINSIDQTKHIWRFLSQ